jgi:GT2 family glycosyltransferase
MEIPKVVVVTVTYGNRWKFLSQVIEAVIRDQHLFRFVIVDNGSVNTQELTEAKNRYGDKIEIHRIEKNIGSAGGFALGLERAQSIECDFVLLLDDDNLPEERALSLFIDRYNLFEGKRVVCGYRPDIQSGAVFTKLPSSSIHKYTFFDVWSFDKIRVFFRKLFYLKNKGNGQAYSSEVKTQAFVYGGAFLPIEAILAAPLPDTQLMLYGDDVEYSWGVIAAGYTVYVCDRPGIRDLDMSFDEGDHILGLFNPTTQPFKVYYRIRNMVRISLRNSSQSTLALHSSIFIWILGLLILGCAKYGPTRMTLARSKLILQAVYGGYAKHARIPALAHLP